MSNGIMSSYSINYPVDNLSSISQVSALFSLYKISSSKYYSGPVLNVRRGLDNQTYDFYADYQGNLATADGLSLSFWLNGTTGNIAIWYDQSGFGNHATQTNTLLQPTFFLTGTNSQNSIYFPNNCFFNLSNGTIPYGNSSYTFIFNHGIISSSTTVSILGSGTNTALGANNILFYNGIYYSVNWVSNNEYFSGYAPNNTVTVTYNSASSLIKTYINGTLAANRIQTNSRNSAATSNYIGFSTGNGYFQSNMSFMYILNSELSTADRNLLENSLSYASVIYQTPNLITNVTNSQKISSALSLNGINNYVSAPTITTKSNGLSVSLWANPSANCAPFSRIFDFIDVSYTHNLYSYFFGNSVVFGSIDISTNTLNTYYDGLIWKSYNVYFNNNTSYFLTAPPLAGYNNKSSGIVTNFTSLSTITNNSFYNQSYYSIEFVGYFLTPANGTGTWTFQTNSDDSSFMWIGSNAISGYTSSNALIVNTTGTTSMALVSATINLTANTYYPIRIQYGQSAGGEGLQVSFITPQGTKYYDGTGFYYNIPYINNTTNYSYTIPFGTSLTKKVSSIAINNNIAIATDTSSNLLYYSTYNVSTSTWSSFSQTLMTTQLSSGSPQSLCFNGTTSVIVSSAGYCYFATWNGTNFSTLTKTLDNVSRNYTGIHITADGTRIVAIADYVYFATWNGTNYTAFTKTLDTNVATGGGIRMSSNGSVIVYSNSGLTYIAIWNGNNYTNSIQTQDASQRIIKNYAFSPDLSILYMLATSNVYYSFWNGSNYGNFYNIPIQSYPIALPNTSIITNGYFSAQTITTNNVLYISTGFVTPPSVTYSGYAIQSSITGWTINTNGGYAAGIINGKANGFITPTTSLTGLNYCFFAQMYYSPLNTYTSLQQSLTLTSGNYILQFNTAIADFIGSSLAPSNFFLTVTIGSQIIASNITSIQNVWQPYTYSFNIATSGTYNLLFYFYYTVANNFASYLLSGINIIKIDSLLNSYTGIECYKINNENNNILLLTDPSNNNIIQTYVPNFPNSQRNILNNVSNNIVAPITPNTWSFLSWTIDLSNNWNIYVNGSIVYTLANQKYPTAMTRTLNYFGKGQNGLNGPYFAGLLDEFRIYNRTLSSTEIQTLYNTFASNYSIISKSTDGINWSNGLPVISKMAFSSNTNNSISFSIAAQSVSVTVDKYIIISTIVPAALTTNMGLGYTLYNEYFNGNPAFFSTASVFTGVSQTYTGKYPITAFTNNYYASDMSSIQTATGNASLLYSTGNYLNNVSIQWTGFFLTPANGAGTWTFQISTNGSSLMWIGNVASTGFDISNCLINGNGSGSVSLNAGQYYPIRIQYGENVGALAFSMTITNPQGATFTNGTGFFYPSNYYSLNIQNYVSSLVSTSNTVLASTISSTVPILTATGLSPFTNYIISCNATNAFGTCQSASIIASTASLLPAISSINVLNTTTTAVTLLLQIPQTTTIRSITAVSTTNNTTISQSFTSPPFQTITITGLVINTTYNTSIYVTNTYGTSKYTAILQTNQTVKTYAPVCWYDGTDSTTLYDGSNNFILLNTTSVSLWKDKTFNGFDLQSISSATNNTYNTNGTITTQNAATSGFVTSATSTPSFSTGNMNLFYMYIPTGNGTGNIATGGGTSNCMFSKSNAVPSILNSGIPVPNTYSLPVPGAYARYKATDYNPTTNNWYDSTGNGNSIPSSQINNTGLSVVKNPAGFYGSSSSFTCIQGTKSTNITFLNNILNQYTLFHVARYADTTQTGAIFASQNSTWWSSGFINGSTGVANHNYLITPPQGSGTANTSWLLSTDSYQLYRGNANSNTIYPQQISYLNGLTINFGSIYGTSAFQVVDIIIYDSYLSIQQIKLVENYLANLYGLTSSLVNIGIPIGNSAGLPVPGAYARFKASDYNPITNSWYDSTGKSNSVPSSQINNNGLKVVTNQSGFYGSNTELSCVQGTTSTTIEFVGYLQQYTIFHVGRYVSNTSNGIIFSSRNVNWLSGFCNNATSVAYHNSWVTSSFIPSATNTSWLLSTDSQYTYKGNGINSTTILNSGITYLPGFSINFSGNYSPSAFQVMDVIIYNSYLTGSQITTIESYLANLYGLTTAMTNMGITLGNTSGLPVAGAYARFQAINYDISKNQWIDSTGMGNSIPSTQITNTGLTLVQSPTNFNGSSSSFTCLQGTTSSTMTIIGYLPQYTIFHVARYTNTTSNGIIFSGPSSSNWESGFWNNNTSFAYHNADMTNKTNPPFANTGWLLSADTAYLYKGNCINTTTTTNSGINYLPSLCINTPYSGNNSSAFQVADVVIYNTYLSPSQITAVETYLANLYGLTTVLTNIGVSIGNNAGLPVAGAYARFQAINYDISKNQWIDSTGMGNSIPSTQITNTGLTLVQSTANFNGSSSSFTCLQGTTSSTMTIMGYLPQYTIFHVARYTGFTNSNGIIFSGPSSINWESGFWNNNTSIAYHSAFLSSYTNPTFANTGWLLSADTAYLYKGNCINTTTTTNTGINYLPTLCINKPYSGNNSSAFQVADVVIYNTYLSPSQITAVETYLANLYGLTTAMTNIGISVGNNAGLPVAGAYARFQAINYDISKNQWIDSTGMGNSIPSTQITNTGLSLVQTTANTNYSSLNFKSLQGTTASSMTICGGLNKYTLFHVARYTSTTNTNGIIFSGPSTINWYSGFYNNNTSVAYHNATLTNSIANPKIANILYSSALINNPNPLYTYVSGLIWTSYNGYFNDNLTFIDSATVINGNNGSSTGIFTDFSSLSSITNGNWTSQTNYTLKIFGYFLTPDNSTGVWSFTMSSDDASYLWLGSNALSGYTTSNALININGQHIITTVTNTISLTANTVYPILIIYGQYTTTESLQLTFTSPSGVTYTDGTGFFYTSPPPYNPIYTSINTAWLLSTDTIYIYRGNCINSTSNLNSGISNLYGLCINNPYSGFTSSSFQVADIIIYNSYLTASQIAAVESYLANQYGLTIAIANSSVSVGLK